MQVKTDSIKTGEEMGSVFANCRLATIAVAILTLLFGGNALAAPVTTASTNGSGGVADGARSGVDPVTGGASLTIPLDVPTGKRGVTPTLTLVYDSNATTREAGVGWSLPTSSIRRVRSPYTPLPTSGFGFPQQAIFPIGTAAEADRYEIDGKPLVLVCREAADGCAPGETFPASLQGLPYYREQADGTRTRYFLVGELTWLAFDNRGNKTTYGYADEPGSDAIVRIGDVPVAWHIIRHQGAEGGEIHYKWRGHEGPNLPDRRTLQNISYSYSSGPNPTPEYRLDFEWSQGEAYDSTRFANPLVPGTRYFIDAITVSAATWTTSTLVPRYRYKFHYDLGSRTTLRELGLEPLCAGEPSCPSAEFTKFEYSVSSGFGAYPLHFLPKTPSGAQVFSDTGALSLVDINADGYPDLIDGWSRLAINDGAGRLVESCVQDPVAPLPAELAFLAPDLSLTVPGPWRLFNRGHGGLDFLYRDALGIASNGVSFRSDVRPCSSGLDPARSRTSWTIGRQASHSGWHGQDRPGVVTDIDGDGLPDALLVGEDNKTPGRAGQNGLLLSRRTLAANGTAMSRPMSSFVPSSGWSPRAAFADANGDGLPDVFHGGAFVVVFPNIDRAGNYVHGGGRVGDVLLGDGRGSFASGPYTSGEPYLKCVGQGCWYRTPIDPGENECGPDCIPAPSDGIHVMRDIDGDGFADYLQIIPWLNGPVPAPNRLKIRVFHNVPAPDGAGWQSAAHRRLVWCTADVETCKDSEIVVNAFDPAQGFQGLRVLFADADANGVDDLVVVENTGVHDALSFNNGGVRPHLLTKVTSSLGATTTLEYETYQQHISRDYHGAEKLKPGTLPHSTYVVKRSTVSNGMSGAVGRELSTTFHYRRPAYDPWRERFLGFSEVTVVEPTGAAQQIVRTFGPCAEGSGACNQTSDDDPWIAAGPKAILSTLYESDPLASGANPRVFSETETRYILRKFAGADARHRWTTDASATLTRMIDAVPTVEVADRPVATVEDPDVPAGLTLVTEVRTHSSNGAAVIYQESDWDAEGHVVETRRFGRVKGTFGSIVPVDDIRTERAQYEEYPGRFGAAWAYRLSQHTELGTPDRQRRFLYNPDGTLDREQVFVDGGIGLARRHASLRAVAPSPLPPSPGWRTVRTLHYDANGNLDEEATPPTLGVDNDPNHASESCTKIEYDDLFQDFPKRVRTYLGGCTSADYVEESYVFDRTTGKVVDLIDGDGLRRTAEVDMFGRLVSIIDTDGTPGGMMTVPRVQKVYENFGSYSRIHAISLQADASHPDGAPVDDYTFVDGLGEPLMVLSRSNVGWIAGAVTRQDVGLRRMSTYSPFDFVGSVDAPSFTVPQGGNVSTTVSDAYGRIIERWSGPPTSSAAGLIQTEKTKYGLLRYTEYDAEDLRSGPHSDTPRKVMLNGHGEVVRVDEQVGNEEHFQTLEYSSFGELIRRTRGGSAPGARSATSSRVFDSRGLLVENDEPNTGQWRYVYDEAGRLAGTSDPRGCGVNYYYDRAGRGVGEDYSPCDAKHDGYSPPDRATGNGFEVLRTYDRALVADDDAVGLGPARLGRLMAVRDRGALTRYEYDGFGRVAAIERKMAARFRTDLGPAPKYAAHSYRQTIGYDVDGRVDALGTGVDAPELLGADGAAVLRTHYNQRGTVDRVTSSWGELIHSTTLRPDGLPTQVEYGSGNGVMPTATFSYSEDTGSPLLSRALVARSVAAPAWFQPGYPAPPAGHPVQATTISDTSISYDRVGNPLSIVDNDPNAWPQGAAPTSRSYAYDDAYRVTSVNYSRRPGETRKDPFVPEGPHAFPRRALPTRVAQQTFGYDHLDNVTHSGSDLPDASGDRHLGPQQHGGAGPEQVVSADGVEVRYDLAGNVIDTFLVRDGPCEGGMKCRQRLHYEWNEVNELVTAKRFDLGPNEDPALVDPEQVASAVLTYEYSEGERVQKRSVLEDDTTLYVFSTLRIDHTKIVDGFDYESTATNQVAVLGGLGEVVYGQEDLPGASAGRARVFLRLGDSLGSTSVVMELETAEIVERTAYDESGNIDSEYRPDDRWHNYRARLGFTSKEADLEVGLVYFGARYYSPMLRRWLSPDPLRVHAWGGDANPYSYVSGRSSASVDPDGLESTPSGGNPRDPCADGGCRDSGSAGPSVESRVPSRWERAWNRMMGPAPPMKEREIEVSREDASRQAAGMAQLHSAVQRWGGMVVGMHRGALGSPVLFGKLDMAAVRARTWNNLREMVISPSPPIQMVGEALGSTRLGQAILGSERTKAQVARALSLDVSDRGDPRMSARAAQEATELITEALGQAGAAAVQSVRAAQAARRSAQAARGAPKLLGQPITWKAKDLARVVSKHGPDISGKGGMAKSRFIVGEDIAALIKSGTHQQAVVQAGSKNMIRTFDVGRVIGTDVATGRPTSIMNIVTSPLGRLVTAFPGTP